MHKPILVAASLIVLAVLIEAPASAQPRCSEKSFSATGNPSVVIFAGRRSAHTAWSANVRNELGDAYASWGRSRNRRITCLRAERRFLCTVSATPCIAITAGK